MDVDIPQGRTAIEGLAGALATYGAHRAYVASWRKRVRSDKFFGSPAYTLRCEGGRVGLLALTESMVVDDAGPRVALRAVMLRLPGSSDLVRIAYGSAPNGEVIRNYVFGDATYRGTPRPIKPVEREGDIVDLATKVLGVDQPYDYGAPYVRLMRREGIPLRAIESLDQEVVGTDPPAGAIHDDIGTIARLLEASIGAQYAYADGILLRRSDEMHYVITLGSGRQARIGLSTDLPDRAEQGAPVLYVRPDREDVGAFTRPLFERLSALGPISAPSTGGARIVAVEPSRLRFDDRGATLASVARHFDRLFRRAESDLPTAVVDAAQPLRTLLRNRVKGQPFVETADWGACWARLSEAAGTIPLAPGTPPDLSKFAVAVAVGDFATRNMPTMPGAVPKTRSSADIEGLRMSALLEGTRQFIRCAEEVRGGLGMHSWDIQRLDRMSRGGEEFGEAQANGLGGCLRQIHDAGHARNASTQEAMEWVQRTRPVLGYLMCMARA